MHEKNSQMVKKVLLTLAKKKNLKGLKGVAAYIGVPETTVYGWVRNGNIADTGPILAMFPDVDIEWLRTGQTAQTTTATSHAIAITGAVSEVGSITVGVDTGAGGQADLEERHNIPRETVQATHKVRSSIEAAYNITRADRDGTTTNEDTLPMVRNYRELARMDADTLGEIQTWLNDMERWRPGFTDWFRLEFQNRFPEFDEWKQRVIKKSVGAGD